MGKLPRLDIIFSCLSLVFPYALEGSGWTVDTRFSSQHEADRFNLFCLQFFSPKKCSSNFPLSMTLRGSRRVEMLLVFFCQKLSIGSDCIVIFIPLDFFSKCQFSWPATLLGLNHFRFRTVHPWPLELKSVLHEWRYHLGFTGGRVQGGGRGTEEIDVRTRWNRHFLIQSCKRWIIFLSGRFHSISYSFFSILYLSETTISCKFPFLSADLSAHWCAQNGCDSVTVCSSTISPCRIWGTVSAHTLCAGNYRTRALCAYTRTNF